MKPRKIAVFTGTRADYGLLYWIMRELDADPALELQLIVAGSHLSPALGYTIEQIRHDGFAISWQINNLREDDSTTATTHALAACTAGMADALAALEPDLLLLLGDRYEALGAAQAALLARVPVAHLHGGEITEGALDDAIRHAITKLSHLHFTSTEAYRQRVIQLGEDPAHVYNTGAPGLEHFVRTPRLSRTELEASLGFTLGSQPLLVTYHPATLEQGSQRQALQAMLEALDNFPEHQVVITYPNADAEGRSLIPLLHAYAERQPERVLVIPSLGQQRYVSLMGLCAAVVGNSSSGILEAPTAGVPTVNIGSRQQGRIAAASVLNCETDRLAIVACVQQALSKEFRQKCRRQQNPYGDGHVAQTVCRILKQIPLSGLTQKTFFDQ